MKLFNLYNTLYDTMSLHAKIVKMLHFFHEFFTKCNILKLTSKKYLSKQTYPKIATQIDIPQNIVGLILNNSVSLCSR